MCRVGARVRGRGVSGATGFADPVVGCCVCGSLEAERHQHYLACFVWTRWASERDRLHIQRLVRMRRTSCSSALGGCRAAGAAPDPAVLECSGGAARFPPSALEERRARSNGGEREPRVGARIGACGDPRRAAAQRFARRQGRAGAAARGAPGVVKKGAFSPARFTTITPKTRQRTLANTLNSQPCWVSTRSLEASCLFSALYIIVC